MSARVHHVGEVFKVSFPKLFLYSHHQHLEVIFFFLKSQLVNATPQRSIQRVEQRTPNNIGLILSDYIQQIRNQLTTNDGKNEQNYNTRKASKKHRLFGYTYIHYFFQSWRETSEGMVSLFEYPTKTLWCITEKWSHSQQVPATNGPSEAMGHIQFSLNFTDLAASFFSGYVNVAVWIFTKAKKVSKFICFLRLRVWTTRTHIKCFRLAKTNASLAFSQIPHLSSTTPTS